MVADVKVDVKPAVATDGASTCDNSDSLSDLVNLLSIPKVELDSYDGDPREYQSFISMFDELVDSKLKDDQLKLSRLMQYTTGTAKSAIKSCSLIGGSDGYAQARAILKSRFGNTHLVTQTIIADLRNGKRVTKPHELLQLADDLSTASAALRNISAFVINRSSICNHDHIKPASQWLDNWFYLFIYLSDWNGTPRTW